MLGWTCPDTAVTEPLLFHLAANGGNTEVVRELISAGVDVNHNLTTVHVGRTAMHLAVCWGHLDTARVLLMERSLETATDDNVVALCAS